MAPVSNESGNFSVNLVQELEAGLPMNMVIQILLILIVGLIANITGLALLVRYSLPTSFMPLFLVKVLAWVDTLSLVSFIVRTAVSPALNAMGPSVLCNTNGFTNGLFPYASGFIATLMSIERCIALTKPMYYQTYVTKKATILMLVLALVLAVFINGLPLIGIGSFYEIADGEVKCKYAWFPNSSSGDLVHFVAYLFWGIAMVVITVCCNIAVIRELHDMKNRVFALGEDDSLNSQSGSNAGGTRHHRQRKSNNSRQVRFAKMMIVIAVIFTVCWLPWMITITLKKCGMTTSFEGDQLTTRMLLANHAIDPFIYVMMWKSMRRRVARVLCQSFSIFGCVGCVCYCEPGHRQQQRAIEISSITPAGIPTMNASTAFSVYNTKVTNFDKFTTSR